jgi:hypothetical protein
VNDLFCLFFKDKIIQTSKRKRRNKEEVNLDKVLWYREKERERLKILEEIKYEEIITLRNHFSFNILGSNNKRAGA